MADLGSIAKSGYLTYDVGAKGPASNTQNLGSIAQWGNVTFDAGVTAPTSVGQALPVITEQGSLVFSVPSARVTASQLASAVKLIVKIRDGLTALLSRNGILGSKSRDGIIVIGVP